MDVFSSFYFFFFFFNPFWFCKTFIHAAKPRPEQICTHLKAQCATFDPAHGIENLSAYVDSRRQRGTEDFLFEGPFT